MAAVPSGPNWTPPPTIPIKKKLPAELTTAGRKMTMGASLTSNDLYKFIFNQINNVYKDKFLFK
jgi:hypothetical protein